LFRSFGPCAGHKSKETRNSGNVFFRLGAFSAPGQGSILPCARLPRRSARTTSARGGLIERCCVCGAAAGSKGAAGAAGSRNDTRGPLGGLGAHPSPSRTQSPGAARRRAAGAQRAGEPIGGKAARPPQQRAAPPRPAYSQWPPSASPPRSPSQAYPRPRKRTRSGCLRSGWSFLSERRVR